MTREDIDRIASEYFNDKESEHEMDEVFDIAKKALDMAIKALEQDPCEDAISRQAVKEFVEYIQTIKDKYNDGDLSINYGTICALVIRGWKLVESEDVIKDMPPANPQSKTRWIPVSERLPKAFEFVNCTCHSLIDDREDWVVETVYVPQPQDSPYSDWGNIPMLNWGHAEVIAWVHRDIPEPYKAEIKPQERSDE